MLSRTKHKKDCIRHLLALHIKKPPSRIEKIKRSILSDQTSRPRCRNWTTRDIPKKEKEKKREN